METISILSFNRTGSTVVAQSLAQVLDLKQPRSGGKYCGEITNISTVLMRFDENGRDVNVPYKLPLPEGTYVKTYDQIDGFVQRRKMYDNPKPFEMGSERYLQEVKKRSQLLRQNVANKHKSLFKIQTRTFVQYFNDTSLLDGYSFIFCARRDAREQILSNLVMKNTHIMHIGFEDHILDLPTFEVKKYHYEYYVEALKDTIQLFEHYRKQGQIHNIIHYEDWQNDAEQILPLLGYDKQPVHTFKKIKYKQGHKGNLVNNLEEVYEWFKGDEDILDYQYTL